MKSVSTTKKGFTIVELLIVIVVIAILAAISIVSYNGIQQRARTSELLVQMNQIQKTIQVEALENGGQSIALKAPLAYLTTQGTTPLVTPLTNAQEITLYVVFNTSNTPSTAWSHIGSLQPHLDASRGLAIRTDTPGTNTVHGFYATSSNANMIIQYTNVLNTTGRHVGWITARAGTVTSSFDMSTPTNRTLNAHTGWNFTNLLLGSSPAASGVAAIVFPEYHDEATRTEVLRWLDRQYAIDYYN